MAFSLSNNVRWCGAFPYIAGHEKTLRGRGFLEPKVMDAIFRIACDGTACVERELRSKFNRVAVTRDSVTVVVSDFYGIGLPVLLTVFVAGDPIFPAGEVLASASRVDLRTLVDLDDRLRGAA